MVKIGLLVPYEEMLVIGKKIIKEQELEVEYMRVIQTVDAVNEARMAIDAGVHIIVAHGYQAKLIKQYTNIPLVEIRLHAQEIGLLIKRAKETTKKEHPRIGIIAFENMLCDMSYMEDLFDVKLLVESLGRTEDNAKALYAMSNKKPDIIIGGEITCEEAEKMGYPTLFYRSTEESISEALHSAKKMAYAAESEKQNTAQIETILDASFNGIIKINTEGKLIVVNKPIENLIGKTAEEVIGTSISEIFPEFDMGAIWDILHGKRENYTISVDIRNQSWILLVAPIQYDDKITGAIISLHKVNDLVQKKKHTQDEMILRGFTAQATFHNVYTENEQMGKVLEQAKEYALSDSPILIYSETGTESHLIAEAIHNSSERKSGPFVSINMSGVDKDKQLEILFGGEYGLTDVQTRMKGAFIKANHGTVFIKGIEDLTLRVQQQIVRVMSSWQITKTDMQSIDNVNVRVMVSSKINLYCLVKEGKFSEELFYLIQGLTLEIPSLSQRKEDLQYYFKKFFKEYCQKYNKYLVLTHGGKDKINQLLWQGNLIQLKTFCERLVITADKRNIDEVRIQNLYSELYPYISEIGGEEKVVIYKSPEAVKLSELLEKHHGNRNLVAEELGISTTTLWRKMKKYGVEAKYK